MRDEGVEAMLVLYKLTSLLISIDKDTRVSNDEDSRIRARVRADTDRPAHMQARAHTYENMKRRM